MRDFIKKMRETGIDYRLARTIADTDLSNGEITATQLVEFEILWPQTRDIQPLKGRWVGFNY